MMLRDLRVRSRAVSSKQGLMSDNNSLPSSPNAKPSRPTSSSLFTSPRLFLGLSPKGLSDSESAISPTSILESKHFSPIEFSDMNSRKPENRHHPFGIGDSRAIGLGIVDALSNDTTSKKSSNSVSRKVLFGSELKVQIPLIKSNSNSPTGSCSPIEFGVKTKNSQLGVNSPAWRPPTGTANLGSDALASSPLIFTGCLSASEMELSEDYTRVISHGPNPRTTHIFDNCIVKSCVVDSVASRNENSFSQDRFLSFCHACKKDLGQGKEIFIYRGEKAFCSRECRHREMMFDEGIEKCS